jgi:four helix bundle protein
MKPADGLKLRTKDFALRIIKLFQALPRSDEARIIGKQLLRSGTSVGANYRAACRSRSRAEFLARLGVVVEEIDETVYWLDLLAASNILAQPRLAALQREAAELFRIFVASQLTAKANKRLNDAQRSARR